MPHNLLNDFDIGFVFTEPGTKCVPEIVDGKMPDKNGLSVFLLCSLFLSLIVSCVYPFYRSVDSLRIMHITLTVCKDKAAVTVYLCFIIPPSASAAASPEATPGALHPTWVLSGILRLSLAL